MISRKWKANQQQILTISAVESLGVNKNHHLGGFFRCLKVKISFPSKDNLHCKYANADCLAQAVRLII